MPPSVWGRSSDPRPFSKLSSSRTLLPALGEDGGVPCGGWQVIVCSLAEKLFVQLTDNVFLPQELDPGRFLWHCKQRWPQKAPAEPRYLGSPPAAAGISSRESSSSGCSFACWVKTRGFRQSCCSSHLCFATLLETLSHPPPRLPVSNSALLLPSAIRRCGRFLPLC